MAKLKNVLRNWHAFQMVKMMIFVMPSQKGCLDLDQRQEPNSSTNLFMTTIRS